MHQADTNYINDLPQRFERKFYLRPSQVSLARSLLQHICRPDKEYPSEQINSLYFDTIDLEQHERSGAGDARKDKVRIRWYGGEEALRESVPIFIELKSKDGYAGIKQRRKLSAPADALKTENLGKGIIPNSVLMETLAGFGYFPDQLLLPVIRISYWRYRFSDFVTGQRVSLDCHIRSTMVMRKRGYGEKDLELAGGVIEIKGRTMELPPTLMRMKMLYLDWTRFSKYSACLDSHTEAPGAQGRLLPSGRMDWTN